MTVTVAAVSHKGVVRQRNEDVVFLPNWVSSGSTVAPLQVVLENLSGVDLCLGVADGMGGHLGGDVAARHAATFLSTASSDIEAQLHALNSHVYEASLSDRNLSAMGATVAGLMLSAGTLVGFNVGDARVYQWESGYLVRLSTDDRVVGETSTLTQSIGGTSRPTSIQPHVFDIGVGNEGHLLICSDGLYSAVPFAAIQELMAQGSPLDRATALLSAALQAGADDNVSLLVVDIDAGIHPK